MHRNNILKYKESKIWTNAEIIYEIKFWHELEEHDKLIHSSKKVSKNRLLYDQ